MTDAGWAEKKVYRLWGKQSLCWSLVAKLLKAEHARSVRMVKAYLAKYGTEGSPCELICNDLITALQRGRGGKG